MKMKRKRNYEIPLKEAAMLQKAKKGIGRVSITRHPKRGVAIINAWEEDVVYLKLFGITKIVPI